MARPGGRKILAPSFRSEYLIISCCLYNFECRGFIYCNTNPEH